MIETIDRMLSDLERGRLSRRQFAASVAALAASASLVPGALAAHEPTGFRAVSILRGHPKPAIQGHLPSGHTEGMDCCRKRGCGKAGSCAALEIAAIPTFPQPQQQHHLICKSVERRTTALFALELKKRRWRSARSRLNTMAGFLVTPYGRIDGDP
jgi:hypothetical protein